MLTQLLPIKRARQAAHTGLRRYVYVVGAEGGPYKVGSTSNMAVRLSALRNASPTEILVYHVEDVYATGHDAELIEKGAHGLLARCRIRGEWFRLSSPAEAVAAIKRVIGIATEDVKGIAKAPWIDRSPYGARRVRSRANAKLPA